jgi:diguanylate cyclase (GGDEF)-like protein
VLFELGMNAISLSADEARRLETLRDLRALGAPAENRFERILHLARRLLGVPLAEVVLLDDRSKGVAIPDGVLVDPAPRERSLAAFAIASGDEPLVVTDVAGDSRFADHPLVTGEPFVRALAGRALLAVDGHPIGALYVLDHRPRGFTTEELDVLSDLAGWAEAELRLTSADERPDEAAEELEQLRRSSLLDATTGGWNESAIEGILRRELERSSRYGESITVLRLDIDGLDGVRFGCGAEVADEVLRETAARARRAVRPFDAIGRHGADGFLIMLARCGVSEAQVVASRIGRKLRDKPVELAGGGRLEVTVSLGVAAGVSRDGESELEAWVEVADRCLRGARRGGGDRMLVAGFEPPRRELEATAA